MPLKGVADLPLHKGHVPAWLLRIMERLASAIIELLIDEYGPGRVVERFSNPLWFQAFNNIIGMDWDSSGSTTVTTGVLKTITWKHPEWGLLVLGGKGAYAKRVPEELEWAVEALNLPSSKAELLEKASRLTAKIDSALLQDGYMLYHHSLIVSRDGTWSIIQQGMNTEKKMARRYHWFETSNYYNEPHRAVSGWREDIVLNMVAGESRPVRETILDLSREKPSKLISLIGEALRTIKGSRGIMEYLTPTKTGKIIKVPEKRVIFYKPLRIDHSLLERLRRLYEAQPVSMDELLLTPGVGPKTIRALVLVSDLVYNEPPSTRDPVNTPYDPFIYAYAIGGKDGVPYPVNKKEAEKVINILESIIKEARVGRKEKTIALKNLYKIKQKYIISILHETNSPDNKG